MTRTRHVMPVDLHPDDAKTRLDLRDHIADLRRARHPADDYADLVGITRKAVLADERDPTPNPKYAVTQHRLRPLRHRLIATPRGLPAPDPDDPNPGLWQPMTSSADVDRRDAADRELTVATLRAIRNGARVGQRAVAAKLGRHQSLITHLEHVPGGVWLSSLQRYTRALGLVLDLDAHLDLRLEPAP